VKLVLARLAPLTAFLVTLGVVAGGCGSSPSPEEKWASDLCSQITDWKDSVTQSKDDLSEQVQSPSTGTVEAVKSDLTAIKDATTKLSSSLRSLGVPDTPSGTQAKQEVDSFAMQLDTTVQQARQTAASASAEASLTDKLSKLKSLGPTLQTLTDSASTMVQSVEASSKALKDGFQSADSCKPYR
jgi:flagellar biosynthesis chaperone FliJ